MMNAKLYPIKQVVLDLYGQNTTVLKQISDLSALEKIPSVPRKDPAWVTVSDDDFITTLLFSKVLEGRLPAIDSAGHKVAVPATPIQFDNLHVTEPEVNDVLYEAGYRFTWTPKIRKTKPKSVAINWKQRYQSEASDYYQRTWRNNATPNRSNCADTLAKWGALNKIETDLGRIPSAGYLREHVIGTRHWTPPKKPTP
jgi:hypothetical protein